MSRIIKNMFLFRPGMAGFLLLLCFFNPASAEEMSDINYVKITSGMVVNYGEPSLNRLHYLKLGVHVRVENAGGADLVEYHLPAIQDLLVGILSSKEELQIRSADGREALRQEALSEIQYYLEKEEGEPVIKDLLFTTFVVQR